MTALDIETIEHLDFVFEIPCDSSFFWVKKRSTCGAVAEFKVLKMHHCEAEPRWRFWCEPCCLTKMKGPVMCLHCDATLPSIRDQILLIERIK